MYFVTTGQDVYKRSSTAGNQNETGEESKVYKPEVGPEINENDGIPLIGLPPDFE